MTNKPCFMLYLVSVEQLHTHNLQNQCSDYSAQNLINEV